MGRAQPGGKTRHAEEEQEMILASVLICLVIMSAVAVIISLVRMSRATRKLAVVVDTHLWDDEFGEGTC